LLFLKFLLVVLVAAAHSIRLARRRSVLMLIGAAWLFLLLGLVRCGTFLCVMFRLVVGARVRLLRRIAGLVLTRVMRFRLLLLGLIRCGFGIGV
jgi:hypothetical protein